MEILFTAVKIGIVAFTAMVVGALVLQWLIGLLLDDLCIGYKKIEVVRAKSGYHSMTGGTHHDEIVVKYTPGRILGVVRQTAQIRYARVNGRWSSSIGDVPQPVSNIQQRRLTDLWVEFAPTQP